MSLGRVNINKEPTKSGVYWRVILGSSYLAGKCCDDLFQNCQNSLKVTLRRATKDDASNLMIAPNWGAITLHH